MSESRWLWYWENNNGKWILFGEEEEWGVCDVDSEDIEDAYIQAWKPELTFKNDEYTYTIDFATMTQKNLQTGNVRAVSRRPKTQSLEKMQWYWRNNSGNWILFGTKEEWGHPNMDSDDIEAAYIYGTKPEITFKNNSYKYTLFFRTMTQRNEETCKVREVARRTSTYSEDVARVFPCFWGSNTLHTGFKLLQLNPHRTTREQRMYREIESLFTKTCSNVVVRIERVLNPQLWKAYVGRRKTMQLSAGTININEQQLFHGTDTDSLAPILQQGFDPRLAGSKNGTLYGKGSYFARDASFSQDYSGNSQMLVCRVLLGTYTVGRSSMTTPPSSYSSTADRDDDATIFVTYQCDQSYPEYVITFN